MFFHESPNKMIKLIKVATYSNISNSKSLFLKEYQQVLKYNVRKSTTHIIDEKPKKITLLGWCLLAVPAATFGLGCWQTQRKVWKENLIKELEDKINAKPVPLPDNLDDLENMEYRPVKVRGQFLHDREVYMGPRSFIEKGTDTSKSGLFSAGSKGIGFHIITPFKLEGREEIILVNRGWVPKAYLSPASRKVGQIAEEVDLTGVVRLNETRPQFSPESRGDHYLYRNLPKICAQTGASPIFLDARVETTVQGGPIGGQTRITLRNDHLSYLITWFSLSAFTTVMWYNSIYKKFRV